MIGREKENDAILVNFNTVASLDFIDTTNIEVYTKGNRKICGSKSPTPLSNWLCLFPFLKISMTGKLNLT